MNYNIYMPCWDCPYGHSCAYYSDPVWDQWILNNQLCPAKTYNIYSIYKAIKNKKIESSNLYKLNNSIKS